MSRSYRQPYYTWSSVKSSAHADKKMAARGVRRAQNNAIRTCENWDELIIPHRRECYWNNVYQWKRDGRQFLFQWNHNDFNPYWLRSNGSPWTDEELIQHMLEGIERSEKFLADLKRK